jgi:hypothetical protein
MANPITCPNVYGTLTNFYRKGELDSILAQKSLSLHTHTQLQIFDINIATAINDFFNSNGAIKSKYSYVNLTPENPDDDVINLPVITLSADASLNGEPYNNVQILSLLSKAENLVIPQGDGVTTDVILKGALHFKDPVNDILTISATDKSLKVKNIVVNNYSAPVLRINEVALGISDGTALQSQFEAPLFNQTYLVINPHGNFNQPDEPIVSGGSEVMANSFLSPSLKALKKNIVDVDFKELTDAILTAKTVEYSYVTEYITRRIGILADQSSELLTRGLGDRMDLGSTLACMVASIISIADAQDAVLEGA